MELDPTILVRAGGSFLLAVVGLAALVLSRRERPAIALGGFLVCQGVYWTGQNLFGGNAAAGVYWVPVAVLLTLARSAAYTLLLVEWPARLRDRRQLLVPLALGVLVGVVTFVGTTSAGWDRIRASATVPEPHLAWTYVRVAISAVNAGLFVALIVALPLKFLAARPDEVDLRRRAAWGGVLLFLGPLELGEWLAQPGSLWDAALASPIGPAVLFVAVPLWLAATRRPQGQLAARVAILFAGIALAGLLIAIAWPPDSHGATQPVENAIVGAQRSAYAFFFAYGIARLGFLGHAIQLRTARRGTLAMGALAALFIVAQVAQQFLSAQYGLLMGGVVAGALLFVANPVQRAMEAFAAPQTEVTRRVPIQDAGAENIYRETLRMAMKDGRVTSEEEQHLAELGERLGISARRAVALRHEVEREKGAR